MELQKNNTEIFLDLLTNFPQWKYVEKNKQIKKKTAKI